MAVLDHGTRRSGMWVRRVQAGTCRVTRGRGRPGRRCRLGPMTQVTCSPTGLRCRRCAGQRARARGRRDRCRDTGPCGLVSPAARAPRWSLCGLPGEPVAALLALAPGPRGNGLELAPVAQRASGMVGRPGQRCCVRGRSPRLLLGCVAFGLGYRGEVSRRGNRPVQSPGEAPGVAAVNGALQVCPGGCVVEAQRCGDVGGAHSPGCAAR